MSFEIPQSFDSIPSSIESYEARQGILIVVCGPTGVGKSTVVDGLKASIPNLMQVISTTTRPMRPGEIDGVHYNFTSRDNFEERVRLGKFLEHAKYGGNLYGVEKEAIGKVFNGQDLLWIVNMGQVVQLKKVIEDAYDSDTSDELWERTLPIFIGAPDEKTLRDRYMQRPGSTDNEFLLRTNEDNRIWNQQNHMFPNVVINLTAQSEDTVSIITRMIESHRKTMQI